MVKTLLLSAAFLLSAVWLQAQDQSSTSSSGQTGSSQTGSSQAGTAGSSATVQGCLQGSAGNYTLMSDTGMTYQLQGDTSKLAEHVGHEVAITGSASGGSTGGNSADTGTGAKPGETGTGTSGTASGSQPTINVSSFQHVSKTCTSGASTTAPTK